MLFRPHQVGVDGQQICVWCGLRTVEGIGHRHSRVEQSSERRGRSNVAEDEIASPSARNDGNIVCSALAWHRLIRARSPQSYTEESLAE